LASDSIKTLEVGAHTSEAAMVQANQENRAALHNARVAARKSEYKAAEDMAKAMSEADVVNTLTHAIGTAPVAK
jgi:cob(I)alamin adenosyltransferase